MKAILAALLLIFLIAACGPSNNGTGAEPPATLPLPEVNVEQVPDPQSSIEQFIMAWSAQNYNGMYERLSAESRTSFTRDDFVAVYEEVGRTTSLQEVSVGSTEASVRNPREADVSVEIQIESAVVGSISRQVDFSLIREDDEWKIKWAPTLIFPGLAPGTELFMEIASPVRAEILDRNGEPLAAQEDVVAMWIVPNQVGGEEGESAMLGALSRLLAQRSENIQNLYDDIRQFDWRVPLGEVSVEQFDTVSGTLASAGGVQWGTYTGRYYPQNGLAQHAVGYVAQIQADELEEYLQQGYAQDAFVGQIGLEAVLEDALRGSPGGTL